MYSKGESITKASSATGNNGNQAGAMRGQHLVTPYFTIFVEGRFVKQDK